MTSRMPVREIIQDLFDTSGAYYEFVLLNGRESNAAEFAEFKPKYIAAVKAGAFRVVVDNEDDE